MRTQLMFRVLLLALVLPAAASAQSSEAFVEQAVPTAVRGAAGAGVGPLEALASLPVLSPGTNAVVLDQRGVGNGVDVRQTGRDNAVVVSQTGVGNAVDIDQADDDNLFLAVVVGAGNTVDAVQADGDNVYSLVLAGNGTDHSVLQLGGGNVAVQFVAPGATPVDIEQRGRGIEVRVERR